MRIYLKKEWIRVKAESRIWKIPFCMYWVPFLGFNEKWATKSLLKKYDRIKTYEFKPWVVLDFQEEDINHINIAGIQRAEQICAPSETNTIHQERAAQERQRLREALLAGDSTINSPDGQSAGAAIKVPDGKLA